MVYNPNKINIIPDKYIDIFIKKIIFSKTSSSIAAGVL
jgi:hypothetical protein